MVVVSLIEQKFLQKALVFLYVKSENAPTVRAVEKIFESKKVWETK